MASKVIVVGGGAAGLAAAYTLRKRWGVEVSLFEATGVPGGRMYGEVIDGFHIDSGACIFHETQDTIRRFSKEQGISFEKSPREHVGTIHRTGKAYKLSIERKLALDNLRTLLSFNLFSLKELRRLSGSAKCSIAARQTTSVTASENTGGSIRTVGRTTTPRLRETGRWTGCMSRL